MFKLKRPCANCPFRKGQGELFQLRRSRLLEIFGAIAFQCHRTVDYNTDDGQPGAGDHPQQCAGLMSLLHREGRDNQIMQVGQRLGAFYPAQLDHSEVYASIDDAINAHIGKRPNGPAQLRPKVARSAGPESLETRAHQTPAIATWRKT